MIMNSKKGSFRVDEVASYFSVSKRTVYSWIKSGALQSVGERAGRRIPKDAISKSFKTPPPPDLTSLKFVRRAINNRISGAINATIRGRCHKRDWEKVVGYTVDELKRHLEKKFTEGMSWEKFVNGKIHIDHKIPKCIFNFTSVKDMDFKRCWALSNLQPMWAKENIKKADSISKPFQPCLLLSLED